MDPHQPNRIQKALFGIGFIAFFLVGFGCSYPAWGIALCLGAPTVTETALPNPATVTVENFIDTVRRFQRVFSGTAGYSLGEREIQWIVHSENSLRMRAFQVSGEPDRLKMIASSYLNNEDYGKAFEYFSRATDDCGVETTLWLLGHADLTPPYEVLAQEHRGPIPARSSEQFRLETPQYTFVSFFKGPLYRYDKDRASHSIVFMQADRLDWTKRLVWKDPWLEMTSRDGTQLRFNVGNSHLEEIPPPPPTSSEATGGWRGEI